MSISLNIQNLTESGENIQFIPAEIQYDGKANISSYFETTIRNKGERALARYGNYRDRANGSVVQILWGASGHVWLCLWEQDFWTITVLTASLRGRPLTGKSHEIPSGYTGVIVTEARRPFSDDEERNLTASQSFQKFNYWNLDLQPSGEDKLEQAVKWIDIAKAFNFWNLDLQPSGEDKLEQAVKWIDIAKALQDPVSMSDSQGSLKSEPSM